MDSPEKPCFNIERVWMGRFPSGGDLLRTLAEFASENGIQCGVILGIGAVKKACVGFYDQDGKRYERIEFNGDMEILNLTGNISIKEGKPFVHAHIILSDNTGRSFGGHLLEGTEVFVFEYKVFQLNRDGGPLQRELEKGSGLFLWKAEEAG
ncbi:MAG: DNA-binding protein [Deltaproteobacteria bacterium]|nr:DNA-binding protein [Deltaproteobacteria bacterium]